MGEWEERRPPRATTVVGGLYLVAAGSHVGLVSADPSVYRSFADRGLFAFVRSGWIGVLALHALLLLFGWGSWLYAVRAVALLGWLARRD